MIEESGETGERSVKPVPDPTTLTTELTLREIANLRILVEQAIEGLRSNIETRLDGMDKAIELLHAHYDKFPHFVNTSVSQLQSLHEEKFRSIGIQFSERDTRDERSSRDGKVAIDAALQASEKAFNAQTASSATAIAKSEAAVTKQMDQINVTISSMTSLLSDKIEDIKNRVNMIEGRAKGVGDSWGVVVGIVGIGIAAVSIIMRHV